MRCCVGLLLFVFSCYVFDCLCVLLLCCYIVGSAAGIVWYCWFVVCHGCVVFVWLLVALLVCWIMYFRFVGWVGVVVGLSVWVFDLCDLWWAIARLGLFVWRLCVGLICGLAFMRLIVVWFVLLFVVYGWLVVVVVVNSVDCGDFFYSLCISYDAGCLCVVSCIAVIMVCFYFGWFII